MICNNWQTCIFLEPRDPCDSNPCVNHGTCERRNPWHYHCKCMPGYSGTNCENARKFFQCFVAEIIIVYNYVINGFIINKI